MAQSFTINAHEVMLDNVRFPVVGGVRRSVITPFPPKITIGDYTRDNKVVESSWIITNLNGGLGVQYANIPRDQDRSWFGDLETRYRFLMLGPRVVEVSTDGADARFITDFGSNLYVITDVEVFQLSGNSLSIEHTIDAGLGQPTAVNQLNNSLWIQCENGILIFNGSSWNSYYDDGVIVDATDLPGTAAIVWDNKYFRLTPDGYMWYYIIPDIGVDPDTATFFSTDWIDAGRLHLPTGYCRQMLMFFDLAGEMVIHAITKRGLYGYSFAEKRWYETPLSFPYTQTAGRGAIVWRGEIYVPAGPTIYKYNGSTVQNVGPAKDDGLPTELQGDIVQLVAGHGFYFSVIQARAQVDSLVGAETDEVRFASPQYRDVVAEQPATQGAIICSPGAAWHTLHYETAGAVMGASSVASTNEGYRLWFSNSNGLYYIDLSAELHNPLQNPTSEFKETGFIVTPWVDTGWAEIDKLALYVECEARNVSDTETILIQVAFDDDDTTYQTLGTITHPGTTVFRIGSIEGKLFRNVKIRMEMARDPAYTKRTPILKQANVTFLRRPESVWGHELQIDCNSDYDGLTREELIEELERIVAKKQAVFFSCTDVDTDETTTGRVVVSRAVGAKQTGSDPRGRFTVSLIDIREPVNEWVTT